LKDINTIAMRNCPHCGKEIQDEAAFCRFCRRDVQPPLWLTSLQKCPYCAEWIERGIERCPLCGKALITEEPFYISEEEDSTERLMNEVRENIFPKDQTNDEAPEESPEEEPVESTFDSPPFQPVPRETQNYQEPSSDPFESQEGLGVLRERQRPEIPLADLDTEAPEVEIKPTRERRRINVPIGRILPWVILIFATVAVVAVAIYAFQELDPLSSLGLVAPQATATETSPAATDEPLETAIASPTYAAATLPPLATATGMPGDCVLWSDISPAMVGQEVCAYGTIKRRFRVDAEIPYMAIFSEEEGTFAIVDRLTFYTQFRPGDCIQAFGEIEIMRGVRPFIDAANNLALCPDDSN
jgi:hypothetical protein